MTGEKIQWLKNGRKVNSSALVVHSQPGIMEGRQRRKSHPGPLAPPLQAWPPLWPQYMGQAQSVC